MSRMPARGRVVADVAVGPACVELDASAANARVLLANGGFERSEALSAKTATLSGDRRVFCLDKVPVNWFFCR